MKEKKKVSKLASVGEAEKAADTIIEDKAKLLTCIMYESLQNRPIFESYLHLSETLSYPQLDYREFEIWYYRFQHGLMDFEYDISEELENKPTLFDMPIDVITRVLGNLNYKTHLVLRKVSKSLRQIVDQRPAPYKSICLSATGNKAILTFDGKETREQSVKAAIRDLKCAIQHPKVQLEVLKIRYYNWHDRMMEKFFDDLEDVFATHPFRQTLDVKTLEMSNKREYGILSVLPHLTPGFLETIDLEGSYIAMEPIIKLKQWKKIKNVNLHGFTARVGLRTISSISRFETARIRFGSVSMKELEVLRDAHLHQPNFVSLELKTTRQIDFASLDEHLGMGIPQERPDRHNRYYPVPDSEDHVIHLYVDKNVAEMSRILKTDIPENDD